MPKYTVILGQLVRETATVVVSAKSQQDLEKRLKEVYDAYDGPWSADIEWGTEPSDSNMVGGKANPKAKVQVVLK